MADNNYMSRGGRFSVRTPAPSTTYGKVDDRRPAVGRAEIIEERVAMPVMVNADSAKKQGIVVLSPQTKTEGVVTKVETIVERVYAPSETAYTDGLVTNGEIIENYVTADGIQGKYRTPLPDQTSTGWSKPIDSVNTDVGPNRLSGPGGGITTESTPNRFSNPSSGAGAGGTDIGTRNWTRPIDGVTNDIGPNGRRGLTGGTTNGVPTNESRPTDGTNSTGSTPLRGSSSSAWTRPLDGNNTGNDGRNWSSGAGTGAGGTDNSTTGWNRPIDGITNDVGNNGRKGPIGGTTNGININESRPTDGVNSTGTIPSRGSSVGASPSALIRPMRGTNNTGNDGRNWSRSGVAGAGGTDIGANGWNRPLGGTTNGIPTNILIRSTGGTNDTGNDGRSWSNGGGAGGTDTGANSWNRPIDGTANDIGPNGRRVLIGGTTFINESRPADGANSTGTIPWRGPSSGANYIGTRPIVGANNTDAGAWSKPIVGTSITGNGRSGQTGETNDTGADWRSGPSVMTIPQQKIDGSLVPPLNSSSRVTPTIATQDEYRPNRVGWASRPNYDISTSRPTFSPGAVVQPRTIQVPWAGQGKFSPSSVVPAKEPTIIDSNEAARRYNGIATVAPLPTIRVIDSLQAAQKYKGIIIPSTRR